MFAPQTLWKHLIKFLYYFFEEGWKHFELLYHFCWIFTHKNCAFVSYVLLLLLGNVSTMVSVQHWPNNTNFFHNSMGRPLSNHLNYLVGFLGLKHCIDIWNVWSMFSNIQWQNISWCFEFFWWKHGHKNWKCMSDVHARDPEKTSLHVSSVLSTSHSECHGNASPRQVLAHCGFFGWCFSCQNLSNMVGALE